MRAALFEMIVGYLVCEIDGNTIDIGEVVHDPKSGKPAEIDVRRVKGRQECWFYECRGRQPAHRMGKKEVTAWIERVNRILRFHRTEDRFQKSRFGFEIWTTGLFDKAALVILEHEKSRRNSIIDRMEGTVPKCGNTRNGCRARQFLTHLMSTTSNIL